MSSPSEVDATKKSRNEYMRGYMKTYNKTRGQKQRQLINTRDRYNRISDRICSNIHSYISLLQEDILDTLLKETETGNDVDTNEITSDKLETDRSRVRGNINEMLDSLDRINSIIHDFRRSGVLIKS